ncbi:MAG: double-strand break repair helicase AddA [Hyphomicrobiaceae bacterium]
MSQDTHPDAGPDGTLSAQQLLRETTAAQHAASDPGASAWVGANAGAGKTHVLKMRVLRLLLAGVEPERILCLTYTKAAAAEMAQRVFRELASWSTMAPEELDKELVDLLGRSPSDSESRAARQLFARAIETPGGLKVQTIHAFCERLLQRFPLEANVPPGFTILDDATAAGLLRDAVDDALIAANAEPHGSLGQAVRLAVAFAAEDQFDKVLAEALRKRDWISQLSRMEGDSGDAATMAATRALYLEAFEVAETDTDAALTAKLAGILSDAQLEQIGRFLAAGSKSDEKLAVDVRKAHAATDVALRAAALADVFMTSAGKPRAENRFITKKSREAEPALADAMLGALGEFARLFDRRRRRRIVDATVALLTIADRVMTHYARAKSQRAALDFDDLIAHSASLLDQSNAAAWVLYKLDGGLDHVLVDEAQDTSPIQWRVIEQLVSEFYAGDSVREELVREAGDGARSVFAVGDEKQSIYSFQGAAPEMFARTGADFDARARAARQTFNRVPLLLSFRTVSPLLDAVDRVFGDHARTPGLSASADVIRHLALRQGQAGLFELWDTEAPDEVEPAPAFAPLEEQAVSSPITRLAEGIASRIAMWLETSERLDSQDRPIRASDILVLVRKRQPFAGEMVRALKRRRIPVAGADRIVLGEHIAVQDLLALADFLLLPEDDLALANVLKSPLFDLDDDDLLRFAPDRPGLLWTALLKAAREDTRLQPAAEQLKRWRAQADFSPPFEFFANLLDRDGGRARMLGRLGPEAADAIDEFINLALNYDEQAPPSLQGFVTWLRAGRREIKRDMEHGRDEVRVMTVHGSKGLEAPIVFLPDTCSAPGSGQPGPLVELDPASVRPGLGETFAWAVRGASKSEPVEDARAREKAARQEEHNRLLYVAMTRARDRLYVGGFEGKNGIAKGSWYETIEAGLDGCLSESNDEAGARLRRLASPQTAAHDAPSRHATTSTEAAPLPEWATRPAPPEPVLTVPLAPSRITVSETDDDGEWASLADLRDAMLPPLEPASQSPLYLARDDRLLRGTITHALLEHLPNIDWALWDETARAFVAARGAELPQSVHDAIVTEALHILDDKRFGEAFGPRSRAEVAVVASVAHPAGSGPTLRVNGQIDRLLRRPDGSVLIVDYKSNRRPPRSAEDASEAYLLQLAAYRIAVQQIFPNATVEAAFLWTDGPLLMPIPSALLDRMEPRLWEVAA